MAKVRRAFATSHGTTATAPIPAAVAPAVVTVAAPAAAAQAAPVSGPPTGHVFPDLTNAQQQALLQNQRSLQNAATQQAVRYYTDPTQTSTGFGKAQNLNHKLENGQPLTAAEKTMKNDLRKLMQPIGSEVTLYRGDHDALLQRLGVSDYTKMTISQLQRAVVGKTLVTKGFMSTTHTPNLSPFMPGGFLGGGREVIMHIHTAKSARIALIQKSQGEVLLDTGTHIRVQAVRSTGSYATPRASTKRKPVVEIDLEVW